MKAKIYHLDKAQLERNFSEIVEEIISSNQFDLEIECDKETGAIRTIIDSTPENEEMLFETLCPLQEEYGVTNILLSMYYCTEHYQSSAYFMYDPVRGYSKHNKIDVTIPLETVKLYVTEEAGEECHSCNDRKSVLYDFGTSREEAKAEGNGICSKCIASNLLYKEIIVEV